MAKKTIISIDGGGIRGIIPLVVLEAIESKMYGDYISDYVDVISGTSTGALISSALCVGNDGDPMYASQILEIYKSRGKQMFVRNVSGQTTVYKSLPLVRLIDQNFGDLKIKDLKKHYFFPLFNVAAREPFVINSFDKSQAYSEKKLATVLKAASAVPDFFEPIQFEDELLADGVVYAKNPSAFLMQALLTAKNPEDQYMMLSFGTGFLDGCNDDIETGAIESHHQVKSLFKRLRGSQYYRIQPEVIKASQEMDNASEDNIALLIEDARNYVNDHQSLITEIANNLL